MDSEVIEKPKQGERLTNAQRSVITAKLVDYLSQGYYNTYQLSKMTHLSYKVVQTYRGLADKLITDRVLNRSNIRNLQITRTYNIIEKLMLDLKSCKSIKDKALIYNQIAKFSQHLALITGLNVETHVNVDHNQLVIVRADNNKKPEFLNETHNDQREVIDAEVVTIKDNPDPEVKPGHLVK